MRRQDAPPAGWYPDPRGGTRLRWWDGLDWTNAHRPAPSIAVPDHEGPRGADSAMAQLAAAAETAGDTVSRARRTDTDMIAEARKVARAEVERAVDLVTRQARDVTSRIDTLISDYGGQVLRWIRRLAIIIVVVALAWFLLQTVVQVSVMEWLGDRVDNLFGGWSGGGIAPAPDHGPG